MQLVFIILIHWIAIYLVDSEHYPTFEQPGPGLFPIATVF